MVDSRFFLLRLRSVIRRTLWLYLELEVKRIYVVLLEKCFSSVRKTGEENWKIVFPTLRKLVFSGFSLNGVLEEGT